MSESNRYLSESAQCRNVIAIFGQNKSMCFICGCKHGYLHLFVCTRSFSIAFHKGHELMQKYRGYPAHTIHQGHRLTGRVFSNWQCSRSGQPAAAQACLSAWTHSSQWLHQLLKPPPLIIHISATAGQNITIFSHIHIHKYVLISSHCEAMQALEVTYAVSLNV